HRGSIECIIATAFYNLYVNHFASGDELNQQHAMHTIARTRRTTPAPLHRLLYQSLIALHQLTFGIGGDRLLILGQHFCQLRTRCLFALLAQCLLLFLFLARLFFLVGLGLLGSLRFLFRVLRFLLIFPFFCVLLGLFLHSFLFRFLGFFQLEQFGLIGLRLGRRCRFDRLRLGLFGRRWRRRNLGRRGVLGLLLHRLHARDRIGVHADQFGLDDAGLRFDFRRFRRKVKIENHQQNQ